ncbi:MAG: hypothetical protein HY868_15405 [Chloroflexi bacterium]|nr:hypothetical protein [Chloroflexota bacterium]
MTNILDTAPIGTVRRHHGIEHATVHILTAHNPDLRLVGKADTTGFNIYGEVARDELIIAAREAVARLQRGESKLAVHPRCGTNLLAAGLLTALAAILALGRKPSIKKLPDVILATTFAAFVAQPLGLQLQARVTTSPDALGARITGVREQYWGNLKIQHVDVEWD